MSSAWGGSWGAAWRNAWGPSDTPAPPPITYMRPPSIPDDEQLRLSTMDIVMLWAGASQTGATSGPLVDSTN